MLRIVLALSLVGPQPSVRAPVAQAPAPAVDAAADAAHQRAVAAHGAAAAKERDRDLEGALVELDRAVAEDPSWMAPRRDRARLHAILAERNRPGVALLEASVADLREILTREPAAPDRAALEQALAERQRRIEEGRAVEKRRRNLQTPALVVGMLGVASVVGGALLTALYPSDVEGVRGQYRRTMGGVAMMSVGVALVAVAIPLQVLATRQARGDAVAQERGLARVRPSRFSAGAAVTRHGVGFGAAFRF